MKNPLKQAMLDILGSDEFDITIRKAGKYRFPTNYMFGRHNHREFEMNYVNSGNCVMEIGGMYNVLKQGDLVLVSPGIPHYFMVGTQRGCSITQLEYRISLPDSLDEEFRFMYGEKEYVLFSDSYSVEHVMESICRYYRDGKPEEYTKAQIAFGFAQLYLELAYARKQDEARGKNGMLNRQGQLLRYINGHYDTKLNIEQLSEKFGISSRTIRKYFEDALGMSCTEYITMLRMEKAKEMLWNTRKSITEISGEVGYSSSQYFSNVFNDYTGMPPGKFRNSWRGVIAEEKLYE